MPVVPRPGRRRRQVLTAVAAAAIAFVGCADDEVDPTPAAESAESIGDDDVTTSASVETAVSSPTTDASAADTAEDAAGGVDVVADPGDTRPDVADPTAPLTSGVENAIDVTVPNGTVVMADPVAIDAPAESVDGLVVSVVGVESADVTTKLPGEIGGPAVVMAIEFSNNSDTTIDLGTVTVDLVLPDGRSVGQVSTEPAVQISGSLTPGDASIATYVFTLPVDERDDVTLTVRHSAEAPVLVFTGSLADA